MKEETPVWMLALKSAALLKVIYISPKSTWIVVKGSFMLSFTYQYFHFICIYFVRSLNICTCYRSTQI